MCMYDYMHTLTQLIMNVCNYFRTYVGINGKVIDVSYGGKEMYGKGGPYFLFAGKKIIICGKY
jgi:hypothetical protein